MKEIIKRYKKAIDDEDWYTIEKIQKEIKNYEKIHNRSKPRLSRPADDDWPGIKDHEQ